MDDQIVTLQDMNTLSNKVAQYFYNNKYNKGEAVALLMETCLEYSPIWLGLSKLGVITALINCNLRKATLLHSIKVSNCKAIIVGPELISGIYLNN